MKNSNVPELRFPEFHGDGEWEETLLKEQVNYENGKAHENDVDMHGKFILVNSKYISSNGIIFKCTNKAYCLAKQNDILMVLSDVPNGKAIAKCFYVDKNDTYTVNQRICRLTSKNDNSLFLFYTINRNPYFLSFDDGVKQTNLKNDDVLSCPLIFPKKIKEQQKIADCLSSLDNVIHAQTQKIEKLTAHKKGLLQKLFPQEGQRMPEFRFPEFRGCGEWEEKKLSTFASIITEKQGNNKYLLLSIEVGKGLISQIEKFGQEIAGASSKNYLVIRKNDFAYNKSATKAYPEGYIALYKGDELGAVPNSIFTCFRIDISKVFSSYLNYLFEQNIHGKWLKKYVAVGGRAHGSLSVSNSDLLNLSIPLPKGENSLIEQQKIADCLSSLDSLILQHTKKLDALKKHKQGLMQGLFPNTNI